MGLAMSALLPSAAMVRAVRSGKLSNSFSAAFIHETGRVFRIAANAILRFQCCHL